MKTANLTLLLLIIFNCTFAQDSAWETKSFNELLNFSLPAAARFSQASYVKAFSGAEKSNYYGFQFYDTLFLEIGTAKQFEESLTGFFSGRAADPLVKKYNILVVDTSINNTKGLMAIFTAADSAEPYKQIYGFATLANNRFYYFYAYTPFAGAVDDEICYFFNSIRFNNKKIKEAAFTLPPVNLFKNAD